jgi:glucose/mannose transport system permease protein
MAYCIFGIPITSLLFFRYYASVPDELVDASKIDGCGFFGIYRRIILPLSGPTFAVVGVWQCTRIWNEYLMALVVLGNPARAPVTVAIKNFSSMGAIPWNLQMAAALIASVPTIVVYLVLGKLFMRGLLEGSLSG